MADKINCKFCRDEMVYCPIDVQSHMFEVHYCYNCSYEVVVGWGESLYKIVNERMYRWSLVAETEVARLWHVGEPGIPGERPNRKMKLVKTFNSHHPNVTPDNIEQKIKFMLLFL